MPVLYWGGSIIITWLASSMFDSVAETAESSAEAMAELRKMAPWIVGGVAVYALMQSGR